MCADPRSRSCGSRVLLAGQMSSSAVPRFAGLAPVAAEAATDISCTNFRKRPARLEVHTPLAGQVFPGNVYIAKANGPASV